ncbi:MAG: hypothetical protein JRG97_06825 [Deltaproteobacteria bacterium]|nr:hypothetical protein [Deltaproteobacteria bacterium]MBW2052199.1 hypothetical protein [Deltaproteobacteria bacterium]MBW2140770.1 hypothetical protein [Deltaproteobacteria bacterium]MBW2323662.1 hypothetical protein [Deltaproteobacteria bacterium]
MVEMVELPEWLWIVIETEGNQDRLFGQHDQEKDIFFIPSFYSQEVGETCLNFLLKVPGRRYEVQAMRAAEIVKTIQTHDYQLLILDENGKVLEDLSPPSNQH